MLGPSSTGYATPQSARTYSPPRRVVERLGRVVRRRRQGSLVILANEPVVP